MNTLTKLEAATIGVAVLVAMSLGPDPIDCPADSDCDGLVYACVMLQLQWGCHLKAHPAPCRAGFVEGT